MANPGVGRQPSKSSSPGLQGRLAIARRWPIASLKNASRYQLIYAVVREIPAGKVSTYGQIAAIVGRGCTAREVGYAMAAVKPEHRVPWQRVINSQGKISLRSGGEVEQRARLESEGVEFDARGRVDFSKYGWHGPDWEWLDHHGFYPAPRLG